MVFKEVMDAIHEWFEQTIESASEMKTEVVKDDAECFRVFFETSGSIAELVVDEPLTYKIQLKTNDEVKNLFMMTPYAYRTRPSDRAKVEALEALECTADFRIFVYKKL